MTTQVKRKIISIKLKKKKKVSFGSLTETEVTMTGHATRILNDQDYVDLLEAENTINRITSIRCHIHIEEDIE